MMKRWLLLVLIAAFSTAGPTQAHVLNANGSVGAVMHVTPEDDPIVGQPSDFFFEFKDREENFAPADCECTITIKNTTNTLVTQPLFQQTTNPTLSDAVFSFTFPEKAVYTIEIHGRSKNATFPPFTLSYDLRVDRDQESTNSSSTAAWISGHIIHIVGTLIIVGVVIYAIIRERLREQTHD